MKGGLVVKINVYLEKAPKGKTMLHLLDYPGCIVKGQSSEDALSCLEEGVTSYMYWRKRHGYSIPECTYKYEVIEEKRGGPFNPGDSAAFFDNDEKPVSNLERDEWLRLLTASRQDLLTICNGMMEDSCTHTFELWSESPNWTVKEILLHIANAERFYITRLFEKGVIPRTPRSKDIFHRLSLMRGNCIEILNNLTEEELNCKVLQGKEYWSARKVFRRFLEHEREHIGQILRIMNYHQLHQNITFSMDEMVRMYSGISWKEGKRIDLE